MSSILTNSLKITLGQHAYLLKIGSIVYIIINSGWRVYRVPASRILSNIEDILIELKSFIGKIEIKSQTSEIITNVENYNKKILINKENRIKKT